jgi:hypothetical protein
VESEEFQLRLRRAASCIACAFKGNLPDMDLNQSTLFQNRVERLYHNLGYVRNMNKVIYMCICFFERPSWCYDKPCTALGGTVVPMWNLPMLDTKVTILLECICLILWFMELGMIYIFARKNSAFYMRVRCGLVAVAFADMLWTAFHPSHWRVGKYLRPVITVAFSASLQQSIGHIMRVVPKIAYVALLLMYLVLIYGCSGVLLFRDYPDHAVYFRNFRETFLNLFVLLTTANNPMVMIPAYEHNRATVLFFVSFVCFGLFFLMNLILATIFDSFKQQVKEERFHQFHCRRAAIREAYVQLKEGERGLALLHRQQQEGGYQKAEQERGEHSPFLAARDQMATDIGLEGEEGSTGGMTGIPLHHCWLMVQHVRKHHHVHLPRQDSDELRLLFDDIRHANGGREQVNEVAFRLLWTKMQVYAYIHRTSDGGYTHEEDEKSKEVANPGEQRRNEKPQPQPQPQPQTSLLTMAALERVVKHPHFHTFFLCLIVFNVIVTMPLMETLLEYEESAKMSQSAHVDGVDVASDLDVHNAAQAFKWWIGVEITFSLLYVFEFFAKVKVFGWHRYWRSGLNRCDMFATWVPFLAELFVVVLIFVSDARLFGEQKDTAWTVFQVCNTTAACRCFFLTPPVHQHGHLQGATRAEDLRRVLHPQVTRSVLQIRLLRVIRLFFGFRPFQIIASTFIQLLPSAIPLLGTLWVLMYTYALVGVELFGGRVYRGEPSLANTAYGRNDYYSLNFNDMAGSIVVLWCLLLVNDWWVLMEGFRVVSIGWVRLYFISFYVVASVVMLSVLTSFILDAFMTAVRRHNDPSSVLRLHIHADTALRGRHAAHWGEGGGEGEGGMQVNAVVDEGEDSYENEPPKATGVDDSGRHSPIEMVHRRRMSARMGSEAKEAQKGAQRYYHFELGLSEHNVQLERFLFPDVIALGHDTDGRPIAKMS